MRMFRRPANAFRARILGPAYARAIVAPESSAGLADDLRLFALTFGGGFIFMAIYLA